MNIKQDLGEVGTWDEAVDSALQTHRETGINCIATISKREFNGGTYVSTPLKGMGFSEVQVIENLRGIGPALYSGHEKLRLILTEVRAAHPSYPEKDTLSVFLTVYLKPGEEIEVR